MWNKIKYWVIGVIGAIIAFISLNKTYKSNKQIRDNKKTIEDNETVIKKAENVNSTAEEVIKKNEEIIDKYTNLRNSDK